MSPRRRPATLLTALVLLGACSGASADDVDNDVVLTEMAIGTSGAWEPGQQVLAVRNEGGAHHNLIVCPGDASGCEDGGVAMELLDKPEVRDEDVLADETSSLVLGAGASAVVRIDELSAGSYRLWCAIPNHAARGMEAIVEVDDA